MLRSLLCLVSVIAALAAPAAVHAADPPWRSDGPDGQSVIALTFDDGYDPQVTAELFDLLVELEVPATFFPYAEAVELDPGLWARIARRSRLANHSLSHVDLTGLDAEQLQRQIAGAERLIEDLTGRPMLHVLRAPYGAVDAGVMRAAGRAGYRLVLDWSLDSRDWDGRAAGDIVARSINGGSGDVILLHAGPAATVKALPAIVAHYRERGFRFVTVEELFAAALRAPRCSGLRPI